MNCVVFGYQVKRMQEDLSLKVNDILPCLLEVKALDVCWVLDGPPLRDQLAKVDVVLFEGNQRLQTVDQFFEQVVNG